MQDFLTSWFEHLSTQSSPSELPRRWQSLIKQAQEGELAHWQQSPPGMLGLILLLNHLPSMLGHHAVERHYDKARALCLSGIRRGFDTQLSLLERRYFYAPLFDSSDDEDRQLLARLLTGMRAQAANTDPAHCRLRDWQDWWQQAECSAVNCQANG